MLTPESRLSQVVALGILIHQWEKDLAGPDQGPAGLSTCHFSSSGRPCMLDANQPEVPSGLYLAGIGVLPGFG